VVVVTGQPLVQAPVEVVPDQAEPIVLARGRVLDQLPQPDLAQRRASRAYRYYFNQIVFIEFSLWAARYHEPGASHR
jgi:hypothetical protein